VQAVIEAFLDPPTSQPPRARTESTVNELIEAVASRTERGPLARRSTWLRSVERCLGGNCPTTFGNGGFPEERWKQALAEAESQLTWIDPDGEPTEVERSTKSKAKGSTSIMSFEAVPTSTRRDRDRDVLETKGAVLDPRAPLLWQHIPMEPIGVLVARTRHTDNLLSAKWALADTALGRDAATLVELGALRMSHGFDPLEFEPIATRACGA
jgi:hypothetical protein